MNHTHTTYPVPPQIAHAPQLPPSHQPETISKPKKLRRISRACDFCHNRSIKCKPSAEQPTTCQNCFDFGVDCTYLRPAKKRGIKSGSTKASSDNGSSSRDGENDARMLLELTNGVHGNGNSNVVSIQEKWKNLVVANEAKIKDLVEVYFEVVYPIFPLFHIPSLRRRIANREYLSDRSFFADIMSICALASSRARDGALFPGHWNANHFQEPSPEIFFAAAQEALPQDLSTMRGLDWMRTFALLALYGIQVGNLNIMHQYLGMHHILVSMDNLHDEKNWPKNIGVVEVELRRRLFWSMYTLEVYVSIVWGSIIRCREAQSHVSYPSEVDDELFSDAGYIEHNSFLPYPSQAITNPNSWLHGWNFTTEMYRILEHRMDDFRRRRPPSGGPYFPSDLFRRDIPHQTIVLEKVMSMYSELPQRFKEAKIAEKGRPGQDDKFSFQAANITVALQLVRMVLFTAEEATTAEKCSIARELLDGFVKVPVIFLRAISSPLLYHLAGIGSILGSTIEGPISETSYFQVREVLLEMAKLLSRLEEGITRPAGAASRLSKQVAQIDKYMMEQRQSEFAASSAFLALALTTTLPTASQSSPNIDPSLHESTINKNGFGAALSQYNFNVTGGNSVQGGMQVGPAAVAPNNNRFQVQLPLHLLEGWPWPSDIGQGLGGI
ncbi:hypothetical protein G7Y89_g7580 [Cudoniella acicularis]|uniref:Zn(2)-C6 fungal-type domain-containing protein n=1 Tax=Cudoniella acicularis TaxID=354080 RepID=A0A8H4W1F0_9HELO|nr:hypothetical protein G7Y89_g7580 [Cudoniella acicularis]